MTLQQTVKAIERIALAQHNVRSFGEGDLYAFMSAPNIKYDVVYLTQNQHQTEESFDRYNFNMFYISRNENVDGTNALQIQSIGKEVLANIIKAFCEIYDAEVYGTIYWQPFIQRFNDECSGIYCIVTLEVPVDSLCVDE